MHEDQNQLWFWSSSHPEERNPMKLGVFNPIFFKLSLEEMLDQLQDAGLTAVEIGAGGYPGDWHCQIDLLLQDEDQRNSYLKQFSDRGMMISAFSCHGNPLSPNLDEAAQYDLILRKTIELASLCHVEVVNCFSGTPGDGQSMVSTWPVVAWPEHFKSVYDWQWDQVIIPYWKKIANLAKQYKVKIAIEMHGGFSVHSPYTALKLRAHTNTWIGVNFDPSHLWWQGIDPVEAIKILGEHKMIFHVHAKDTYLDKKNMNMHGVLDMQPYGDLKNRSWYFRTVGHGHDLSIWRQMLDTLSLYGYDHAISIEHEDALMSIEEGFHKAVKNLKEIMIFEDQKGHLG
jgi:sugar phosphate isomerase/epimerase